MTYHYPAIARFMASHWATDAVHIVPVFGERGAVLEHWVFCLFYNWPLTIRRRIRKRIEKRKNINTRWIHAPAIILIGMAIFAYADKVSLASLQQFASLKGFWYLTFFVPVFCLRERISRTYWLRVRAYH